MRLMKLRSPRFPSPVKLVNRFRRTTHRYLVTGRFRSAPGPIIERYFGGKDCFFVQVGSNDGVTGDPLHELIEANPSWRGIFIEPNDEVFAKLVNNYPADGRFSFEQIAISDSSRDRWFYYVSHETIRATGLPQMYDEISSFSRDHVLKHLTAVRPFVNFTKEPGEYISRKKVRCEPLMSLLERHHVSRIDVFHVDAEGYDLEVIQQLDYGRYRPKLILFEHSHLGDAFASAKSFLSDKDYRVVNCGVLDTMAVRRH